MKHGVFRSIEFWKSALMTLPDNAFFELVRSAFGKIKTPYNKQILLGDLEKFLVRDDIQRTIAGFIDRNDARIIAAISALNEPAPGDMESFFSGDLSYAELQELVVNLEERFILYRFREDDRGLSRLSLNPLLEPILAPFITDNSLLLPSVPVDEVAPDETYEVKAPMLDERILAGLLSFVAENVLFFRGEGKPRKRLIESAKTVFPGLDLETIAGGLQGLGLFQAEEDRLLPEYRRFLDFGTLSRRERMEYCAAGIACFRDTEANSSPWLLRSLLYNTANFIHQLFNSLESDRAYSVQTLMRLIYMLNGKDTMVKINIDGLIDAMEKTGLLVPLSAEYRQIGLVAMESDDDEDDAAMESAPDSAPANAAIVMDTPFSFLVYPEISYNDVIDLAAISVVKEAGITVRFELDRNSAVQAFNRGMSADSMIDLLKRLSLNRIDENLIWTIRDWEKRYGEVSIQRGLVLTLSEERRYLAETKQLAKLITETLAPGIYLLPEDAEERATEAMQKAGVDIIARGRNKNNDMDSYERTSMMRSFFHPLGYTSHLKRQREPTAKNAADKKPETSALPPEAVALISGFHSILDQLRPGKEQRDELAARINRRLVLCESQLKDATVRYERLEAHGLDYMGKAMIARQAIAMQSPVEIVLPSLDNDGERFYGIPKSLDKEGADSVLVVTPFNNSSGKRGSPLRIPLGKISLLRRIKKSIFE